MKRKLLSMALVTAMLCSLLPASAFAAPVVGYVTEEDSMALTEVSYTVGANYVIIIPSAINLNEGNDLSISAMSVNVPEGKSVTVHIDSNSTYENGGNFYLRGTGDNKLRCDIYMGSILVNGLDSLAARFEGGSTTNSVLDYIRFSPQDGGAPGKYTGTLYFKIRVE